jgi:hypothetical protein
MSATVSVARRRAGPVSSELSRAVANSLLVVVPLAFTVFLLLGMLRHHVVAADFHESYFPAARRLLDGGNPYAVTAADVRNGMAFAYPALAAVVLAPFALLADHAADRLYMLLCLALMPATMWVAGARDWRSYGIPLLALPVIVGWQGGNVTIPLVFLVALAWRYRDRPLAAGLIVAAAISLKTFVWPLGLWLLATRRWRAAGWALVSGVVLNLIAWAVVGFDQIATFTRLSHELVDGQWRTGYSLLAVAHHLGLSRNIGEMLLLGASAVLAFALIHRARWPRQERQTMVLALALMLVASPLVWSHYFVVLIVALVLMRPRLSPLWFLPLAMWLCPVTTPQGWQLAIAWAVAGGCLLGPLRYGSVGRRSADRRPQTKHLETLVKTG